MTKSIEHLSIGDTLITVRDELKTIREIHKIPKKFEFAGCLIPLNVMYQCFKTEHGKFIVLDK